MAQLFIISAPSGAGKTSLVSALTTQIPNLVKVVSHTTRQPRSGEIDGEDYFFISKETFEAINLSDGFLEQACVHGNLYGTSNEQVVHNLANDTSVILEIDWQGAQLIKKSFPQAISIFVLPPSLDELASRLKARGSDSREVIEKRLAAAESEMSHSVEYDYVIINERFEVALESVKKIIQST